VLLVVPLYMLWMCVCVCVSDVSDEPLKGWVDGCPPALLLFLLLRRNRRLLAPSTALAAAAGTVCNARFSKLCVCAYICV
jgi:hypothetical protein